MTTRTTSKTVTFSRPFILDGFERVAPAGTYQVETEEELLEDVSFPAWKRVMTSIELTHLGTTQHVWIDPAELHEALMRDGAQLASAVPEATAKVWRDKTRLENAARIVRRKKI
jgi:hypothetical protein